MSIATQSAVEPGLRSAALSPWLFHCFPKKVTTKGSSLLWNLCPPLQAAILLSGLLPFVILTLEWWAFVQTGAPRQWLGLTINVTHAALLSHGQNLSHLRQVNAASEAWEDPEIEAAMHLLCCLMHLAEEKYDLFSQETNHNAKMVPGIHWKHPFLQWFHGTVVVRDSAPTNKGFHVYTCVK